MHSSPSLWVKYSLHSNPAEIDPALAGKRVSTIIWTTTPWTLPASMAVAFHPDEENVAAESGDDVFIVAEKLPQVTAQNCGFAGYKEIARFPGRKREHTKYDPPFLPWEQRQILGVLAEY